MRTMSTSIDFLKLFSMPGIVATGRWITAKSHSSRSTLFGLSVVVGISGYVFGNALPVLLNQTPALPQGLLLGRKAYKEDMENRMLRVRGEAKMNVRRFVDDVSFAVGKESRDRLRNIQRQLRDHYRGIANQTTRSLNESLQATLAAAQIEAGERDTRVRELERQLNILRQVVDNAVKLTPALAAT